MNLVTIEQPNATILRQKAALVSFPLSEDLKKIIAEMVEFIKQLESPFSKPAGIAGPQLDQPWQIFIFQIPEEAKTIRKDIYDTYPLTVWLNPSYEGIVEEGLATDWEACYSVTDRMGEVNRYNTIRYEAYDTDGKKISGIARGFMARVLQHEIDHLNGKLYIDLLNKESRFGSMEEMMPIRGQEMEEYFAAKNNAEEHK